jgi:hypothetical protein
VVSQRSHEEHRIGTAQASTAPSTLADGGSTDGEASAALSDGVSQVMSRRSCTTSNSLRDEFHLDVATSGVGIGADLVRRMHQRLRLVTRQALDLAVQLD